MNFKNDPVCVECAGEWTDAETGEVCRDGIEMKAFGCRVFVS